MQNAGQLKDTNVVMLQIRNKISTLQSGETSDLKVPPIIAFDEKPDPAIYLNRLTRIVELMEDGELECDSCSDRDEDFDQDCTEEQADDLPSKIEVYGRTVHS